MVTPLSEQLAELSVRAKNAEDAMNAAQQEAHDKIAARREKARETASAAAEKVNQQIKSVNDSASRDWGAVRAKVTADMAALKSRVVERQHEHDKRRAEKHADDLEWDASFAIDYAIASIEEANVAVLDAMDARVEAEELN